MLDLSLALYADGSRNASTERSTELTPKARRSLVSVISTPMQIACVDCILAKGANTRLWRAQPSRWRFHMSPWGARSRLDAVLCTVTQMEAETPRPSSAKSCFGRLDADASCLCGLHTHQGRQQDFGELSRAVGASIGSNEKARPLQERAPPASCLLLPASCLLPPASCLLPPASCLLPPASCFLPPASCLLLPGYFSFSRWCASMIDCARCDGTSW
jgi:hypothetical protein